MNRAARSLHLAALPARLLALAALLALAEVAPAQTASPSPPPSPPPPAFKGSLGAGVALTGGNARTKSFNVNLNATYQATEKNLLKVDGQYLRAEAAGEATADKTAVAARDEYKLWARGFVFAELRYYRDAFKNISYLISPLGGFGYRFLDGERVKLSLDGAVGGQFEKDVGRAATSDGALQGGQSFSWKLSPTATLTERATGLWKMSDFDDALYRLELGLGSALTKRLEFKVSYTKDYKTRPPTPLLKKGDDSLVAALVFKIG